MLRLGLRATRGRMASGSRGFAAVGDAIPNVSLDIDFPPKEISLPERLAKRKVILVGLPGAFTPTWSSVQVPGYLEQQAALKAKGIDEVIVYCVNDSAVMKAWAKDQGIDDNEKRFSTRFVDGRAESNVTFLADTRCELTKALDLVMDHPGPLHVLGGLRCKRFAAFYDNGICKALHVSEGPDDPAGDTDPSASLVEGMLPVL